MTSGIMLQTRDDVAKRMRRILGDNGGVKFAHGCYQVRGEHSNAISTVLKDNLLVEVYEVW